MITAVVSRIVIDLLEPDPDLGPSSREALGRCLREGSMVACDVVWAEVAPAFGHAQTRAMEALRDIGIAYSPMSEEAALHAAECWYRFRKWSEGESPLVPVAKPQPVSAPYFPELGSSERTILCPSCAT